MAMLEAGAELISELAQDWRTAPRGQTFQELPVAVQRQLLCDELLRLQVEPAFELVEQLRGEPGRVVKVCSNAVLRTAGPGRVERVASAPEPECFKTTETRVNLRGRQGAGQFGGLSWRWKLGTVSTPKMPAFAGNQEWFDADRVGPEIILRHWRPGDRFRPSGMAQTVKVQDLLTNLKIPRAKRRGLVVGTTADGELWWVEGVRIAEGFKLSRQTVRRLQWSWLRAESPIIGR